MKYYRIKTLIGVLMLLLFGGIIKSVQNDITKTNFFVGSYVGVVLFEQGTTMIQCQHSVVRVVKMGNKASFYFSHDIPILTEIELEVKDGIALTNLEAKETNYIQLDRNKLEMLLAIENKNYTIYAMRE